uniref:Uncharacterized protein n=1 Tax=Arundo donax TaxID=35708 RepID=A0A0A8ZAK8_ARUDO
MSKHFAFFPDYFLVIWSI